MEPNTCYFPTESPDWFMACDYNPGEDAYKLNCRRIPASALPRNKSVAKESIGPHNRTGESVKSPPGRHQAVWKPN
jgi:hypothetical protein